MRAAEVLWEACLHTFLLVCIHCLDQRTLFLEEEITWCHLETVLR